MIKYDEYRDDFETVVRIKKVNGNKRFKLHGENKRKPIRIKDIHRSNKEEERRRMEEI